VKGPAASTDRDRRLRGAVRGDYSTISFKRVKKEVVEENGSLRTDNGDRAARSHESKKPNLRRSREHSHIPEKQTNTDRQRGRAKV